MKRVVDSFKVVSRMWKVILFIFVFQLLLASTVGLQMMKVLDESIGNSLSLDKLQNGFDYTVFTDFMNVHGGSFVVLYGQMRWMVLIYMIIASLISTGLIYCLIHRLVKVSDFMNGGVAHFMKLFFVDLLFSILILGIVGVSFALIGMLFGMAPTSFDTELVFLRWTLFIGLVAILLIIILTLWRLKTKFNYIQTEEGIFRSLSSGWKAFWRSKWTYVFLTLFYLTISILLLLINYAAGDLPLIIMIVVIHIIALAKVFWRVSFYEVIGG